MLIVRCSVKSCVSMCYMSCCRILCQIRLLPICTLTTHTRMLRFVFRNKYMLNTMDVSKHSKKSGEITDVEPFGRWTTRWFALSTAIASVSCWVYFLRTTYCLRPAMAFNDVTSTSPYPHPSTVTQLGLGVLGGCAQAILAVAFYQMRRVTQHRDKGWEDHRTKNEQEMAEELAALDREASMEDERRGGGAGYADDRAREQVSDDDAQYDLDAGAVASEVAPEVGAQVGSQIGEDTFPAAEPLPSGAPLAMPVAKPATRPSYTIGAAPVQAQAEAQSTEVAASASTVRVLV